MTADGRDRGVIILMMVKLFGIVLRVHTILVALCLWCVHTIRSDVLVVIV